jgi:gamma-glutamyltranspeptidase / glutathione hydrolase
MIIRTFHADEIVTDAGLATAPDPYVAAAGGEILQAGGNAVDAAVAMALAEGVAEPWSSGLGGSVTMTVAMRDPDRILTVEGHMISPSGVSSDQYPLAPPQEKRGRLGVFDWPAVVGHVNLYGAKSVAVPGTVAALCAVHEKFGRVPRDQVFAPAARLAGDGMPVNWFTSAMLVADAASLARDPGCREVFMPKGFPLRGPGPLLPERLVQPKLAETLEAIGAKGPEAFYRGSVAASIVKCMREGGGVMTEEDLAAYRPIVTEPPVVARYGPFDVVGAPRAGLPTVLQILYGYDHLVRRNGDEGTGDHLDAVSWARAQALAFADRSRYLTTDPEVAIPWSGLRSRAYAHARIEAHQSGEGEPDPARFSAEPSDGPGRPHRPPSDGHTSHMSAGDRHGNLVSVTGTVLNSFGARLLDPDTGVLLNNGIGYFDPRPGARNGIRGGLMVLSAMTPVVLCNGTGPMAALGASGGPRIITCVAQMIAGLATGRVSLQEVVEEPRIHAEFTPVLVDKRWPEGTAEAIVDAGFEVETVEELATCGNFGRPNGVLIDESGRRHGGVDPIRPGDAAIG